MNNLVDFNNYPVNKVLELLLQDKTTNENIIFATNIYGFDEKEHITVDFLLSDKCKIQPRVAKSLDEQSERTRKNAEVFTPSWICNKMNNHCDEEWFGRKNVFNTEKSTTWKTKTKPVDFRVKRWQDYVESKRLEITCGEAPYIVSRYDAATGEPIAIKDRIGILDRKLRIINENVSDSKEWIKWVYKAFQSVYGYEFQGDNLLIARINILNTFVDYMIDRWDKKPTLTQLRKITNIIVWNIWQMDGITGTVPYREPEEECRQMTFFDFMVDDLSEKKEERIADCRIYDWNENKSIKYKSLKDGK